MFQNSALSGALMLTGIALGSWRAALLAVAGNMVGNLTAWVCRYPAQDIRDGLHGFNGTLVGIAVGVFFRFGWESMLLLILGSVLSTWIARGFSLIRKPGFTAPFILSTWLLLGAAALLAPELRLPAAEKMPTVAPKYLSACSFNFGQVMFQGNSVLTGLLFLLGIAAGGVRGAGYALWGAVLPLGIAFLLSDYEAFNTGLYGYNGVLCAIALAGASVRDFAWATVAVILSVILQCAGMYAGTVTLTAPFVLSVWIVMAIRSLGNYTHFPNGVKYGRINTFFD